MKKLSDLCKRVIDAEKEEGFFFSQVLNLDIIQAQIIDLNLFQLYEQGVNQFGVSIGYYSPVTVNYYKPLAKSEGRDGRSDHITVKDTGEFYRSFRVQVFEDGFIITAQDNYELTINYPGILGLTKESLEKLKEIVLPYYIEIYKKQVLRIN